MPIVGDSAGECNEETLGQCVVIQSADDRELFLPFDARNGRLGEATLGKCCHIQYDVSVRCCHTISR